jgi:hypothetical protein
MCFTLGNIMEYTRRAAVEGWRMIATIVITVPLAIIAINLSGMGMAFSIVCSVFIFFVSGFAVVYAVGNIRAGGMFICRLTDNEFIQTIPDQSCGESFRVKLAEITMIECHESYGDSPRDEWYLHTQDGRHLITINYGNPHRKFGEALRKALPDVKIIHT